MYFFYEPDLKQKIDFGFNSSLIEIEYIKYYQKYFPEFKYYNMGYYVANNSKMEYKSEFIGT
jgi:arginyl-tRNA--protein-N-Asp/Glu arginylyltransferase